LGQETYIRSHAFRMVGGGGEGEVEDAKRPQPNRRRPDTDGPERSEVINEQSEELTTLHGGRGRGAGIAD
jgi:hypothetical protein